MITICRKCKHTPFLNKRIRLTHCKIHSEKRFSYVSDDYFIYSDSYDDCEYKNPDGKCQDYIPLNFNDRIDFIIKKHKVCLEIDIDCIFKNMELNLRRKHGPLYIQMIGRGKRISEKSRIFFEKGKGKQ